MEIKQNNKKYYYTLKQKIKIVKLYNSINPKQTFNIQKKKFAGFILLIINN